MSGTNQFRTFAAGVGANAMSSASWDALTALRSGGFQSGVASSEQFNTLMRQVSTAAAGLGEFIAAQNRNALDSGSASDFATELLAALKSAVGVPVGTVVHGYYATAPAGYLLLSGQLVSRATYPNLWAHALALQAAVPTSMRTDTQWLATNPDNRTSFSTGDGTATFRLPDLRGLFVRNADLGRGFDSGRVLGSFQQSMVQRHKHLSAWGEASPGPFGNSTNANYFGTNAADIDNYMWFTNDGSTENSNLAPNTAGVVGSETRPSSVALAFAIKY